jgi:hypothetical protein
MPFGIKELSEMRMIGKLIAGLAVATFFGVAVTSALATPSWQTCTNLEEAIGNFENSTCTKEKAGGDYEWLEVTGTEAASIVGETLELTDTKVPLIGSTTVICAPGSGEATGSVGPGQYGKISTTKVKEPKANCRGTGGCKSTGVEAVEARNTPWQTELVETESKVLAIIIGTGNGEPGWEVKCENILGGKTTDTCLAEGTGKEESALLTDLATETGSFVLGTFEKAHKTKCTEGKAESGEVGGAVKIESSSGAGFRIVPKIVEAERTGGAGAGPRRCKFALKLEACTIEVKNVSAVEEEVRESIIASGNAAKFGFKNKGCEVGTKLKPAPALGCTVEVWATTNEPGPWVSLYYVKVKQLAAPNRSEGTGIGLEI